MNTGRTKMKRSLFLTLILLMFLSCLNCVDTAKDFFYEKPIPTYEKSYHDNESLDVDYPRVPGHVPDATKQASTDSMCWAMVTCNALVYAGHVLDTSVCVNNLREEFGNVPNNVGPAMGFYFKEYLGVQWSAPEVYQASYGKEDGETLEFLMDNIDDGKPVVLSLGPKVGQTNGHVVLVIGYDLNPDGDEIDLYLVDGDDNVHTTWMTLTYDGEFWPITGNGLYQKFELGYALVVLPYVAPVEAVVPEVTIQWDVYLSDFPQINKTRETSNMCWALSSCEVMYYQGFVDDIGYCANWMLSEYGNRGYAPVVATIKYLTEHYDVDSFETPMAHAMTPLEVLAFVVDQLNTGDPAVLTVGELFGGSGHAVSVYGYTDDGTNITLLVRDSNDGIVPQPPLRHMIVNKTTSKITGTYERFYLGMAFSITP
jgi:hypothetical protein